MNNLARDGMLGHNNPPGLIDHGSDTIKTLSAWLEQHPVVQTEEEAREGKILIDRARLCHKDMEDERKTKVEPLNKQVKAINESYKRVAEPMAKVLGELLVRLDKYAKAEEARRQEVARLARVAAEDAERRAREAEARERESKEDAAQGVVEAGVADATVEADKTFRDYERLTREAARADKATHVKISGGFGRALSQRTKETLELISPLDALKSLGVTVQIREAILTSARHYREVTGELPDGVISKTERSL